MSKIKECFVSRFREGCLIEMDYGQLEVIGLAILSKDEQLKTDLRSGIDMHCMNAANIFNSTYEIVLAAYKDEAHPDHKSWKEKRTVAKVFSFQLQYGSGAKNMAASQNVKLNLAEKFIAEYYNRYPQVKQWQEDNIEEVNRWHEPSGKKSAMGYPTNKGYLESPTGRVYQFTEYDAPQFMKERGIHTSFSPTQIKNYPVQGFSTGDVVPLAVGEVAKYLYMNEIEHKICLINTIHDSIIFDAAPMEAFDNEPVKLIEHLGNLKQTMVSIVDSINNLWPAVDFDLPLTVDVEYGQNWGNMKAFNLV